MTAHMTVLQVEKERERELTVPSGSFFQLRCVEREARLRGVGPACPFGSGRSQ